MKDKIWSLEAEEEKKQASAGADDEDSDSENRVSSSNNRIYFYSEVNRPKILSLNKSIQAIGTKLENYANNLKIPIPNMYLHINSYGGSVFAGMAAVDYIKNSPADVITIIDGCAASAATLMSVVGTKRLMHEHSFMLIHQLSTSMWGKFEDLKDDMKNNELLMKVIKNIYEEHTKIPKKELSKILKHDLWWDAKTCLKYGLVDEII
jgi:ATP-dependent Clp endopeptidase proteolytic subunit ClpP